MQCASNLGDARTYLTRGDAGAETCGDAGREMLEAVTNPSTPFALRGIRVRVGRVRKLVLLQHLSVDSLISGNRFFTRHNLWANEVERTGK